MKLIITEKELIAHLNLNSKIIDITHPENTSAAHLLEEKIKNLPYADKFSHVFIQDDKSLVIEIKEEFTIEVLDLYADLVDDVGPILYLLKNILKRFIKRWEAFIEKWEPTIEEQ